MLSRLYRFIDFFAYLFTAKTKHGIHSPFIYAFNQNIIQAQDKHTAFDLIENVRRKMIHSKTKFDFVDLGGGKKSGNRQLSEFVSNTAREAKYCKFLYRLVSQLQPEYSIELGTASGITALYQACALHPDRPLHTIEGSPKLSEIAAFNAVKCGIFDNIKFYTGDFNSELPQLLQTMPRIDYAYIDGNHRYEPTMSYFDMLAAKAHPGTILVFDDINWSEEMKHAWSAIKNDSRISVTVDIFAFGIAFFRTGQKKEHFTIRY